jgi:hypothetical protein
MRRAGLLACVQVKRVAGNVAIDVSQQIFVRRDAEAGRPTLPLDCESASHIDIGERADLAFVGLYVAVALNSYQVAAGRQNDTRPEKNNRNLLHANFASSDYDAATSDLGFRKIGDAGNPACKLTCADRIVCVTVIPQSLVSPRQLRRRRRRIPRDNRRAPNHLPVA